MTVVRNRLSRRVRGVLLVAAAAAAVLSIGAAPASAEPGTLSYIGGGSPIVVKTPTGQDRWCSMGAVGYTAKYGLTGITSKSCAPLGSSLAPQAWLDRGWVGKTVWRSGRYDIALVDLDDAKTVPVRTVGETSITAIGPAPRTGDTVCKQGAANRACGVAAVSLTGTTRIPGFESYRGLNFDLTCTKTIDTGAPIVRGTSLVGIYSNSAAPRCWEPFRPPLQTFSVSTNAQTAVADILAGTGQSFRVL